MNTITALLKKEFHTAKWFLLGGILFFWSFPLLEGIGNYLHSGTARSEAHGPMAIIFGAFYAIVTAGGVVCLDMSEGLYIFWRSRPIHLVPHMVAKYLVGLIVVLFVIVIPTLMLAGLYDSTVSANPVSFEWGVLCIHIPILVLAYSIAFFAGHLFGNMTETAIVSCAATLLFYFVPVLVPALEPVSFFSLITSGRTTTSTDSPLLYSFYFVRELWILNGTAALLCVGLIAGTWICLKRHVQIRLGLQTLCWSLGLVALFLFSAAAFSIGSNLKCVAKNSLPAEKDEYTINSCFERDGGVLLGGHYCEGSQHYDMLHIDRISEEPFYAYRHEIFALEKQLPTQIMMHTKRKIAWTSRRPDIVYYLGINRIGPDNNIHQQFKLYVIKLDEISHIAGIENELLLGEYDAKQIEIEVYQEKAWLAEQTLYILLPDGVAVIDIGGDALPRLLTKVRRPGRSGNMFLPVPTDDLLSQEQKRCITLHFGLDDYQISASDGDRYAEAGENFVSIYKTGTINEETMAQDKIAEYRKMPLEKLTQESARTMILKGNRVFVLNSDRSLTVFQVNESAETLKKTGHYAASEGRFYDMFLRDDGNIALVGTSQLHIVQPPVTDRNK